MQVILNTDTFVVLSHGRFYFRVFGYGIWIAPSKTYRPLFSERYGLTKVWRPFNLLAIKVLRPNA